MTPRLRIETITPLQAREYLAEQKRNRRLRPKRVALYAKQMAADQWTLTGDPIRFNGDGSLVDGQHRLQACVQADVPFTTVVVRGITDTALPHIDIGAGRTANDVFDLAQIPNSRGVSGLCRWMIGWENGSITDTSAMALITRVELLAFYRLHAERLQVAYAIGRSIYGTLRSSEIGWAVLAFILLSLPGECGDDAELFLTGVDDGIDLGGGSPILALRSWVLGRAGRRLDIPEVVAQGIKAWNSWRAHASITHMKAWVRTRHSMPVPDCGDLAVP